MSHAAIHLAFGMLVATLAAFPPLWRAWRRGRPLARPLSIWLSASYLAGLYALVPSILGRLGAPTGLCSGPWMNIFLFHPIIRGLHPGGKVVGSMVIGACFVCQYAVAMLVLRYRMAHPYEAAKSQPSA